jgi:hypothetical protein
MKLVDIESPIGLDRIATWNEVRCAMSSSSQGAFEFGGCGDFREVDSDFRGRAYSLPENIVWLAIVSETLDSTSNGMHFEEAISHSSHCGRGYVRQEATIQKGCNHATAGDGFDHP